MVRLVTNQYLGFSNRGKGLFMDIRHDPADWVLRTTSASAQCRVRGLRNSCRSGLVFSTGPRCERLLPTFVQNRHSQTSVEHIDPPFLDHIKHGKVISTYVLYIFFPHEHVSLNHGLPHGPSSNISKIGHLPEVQRWPAPMGPRRPRILQLFGKRRGSDASDLRRMRRRKGGENGSTWSGWDSNEFDQKWLGGSTIYFFNHVKAIIGQDDY